MKPSLGIFANIYVLPAKIINCIATITAKHPLTTLALCSKSQPVRLAMLALALPITPWTLAAQEHGTSISIIRTPTEIAVAADSLTRDENGKITSEIECKIRKFGKFYVTVAGVSENLRTGFDVWAVLSEATKTDGSVFNKISQFEQRAKPYMWEALRKLEPSKRTLEVNFIGFLKGVPWLISRKLTIDEPVGKVPTVRFQPDSCPGKLCPGELTIAGYFVPNSSLKRFELENPNFLREDLAMAAGKFVQLNIDIKSPGVGGAIDVLRITKNGAEWIKKKPECSEIQSPTAKPATKPTSRKPKRG